MALTERDKKILRILIADGNLTLAQKMATYAAKSDEELDSEIEAYKQKQLSLIQAQRERLDAREADILAGGNPETLPEG